MDDRLRKAYSIPHTATNPLRDACLTSVNLTLDLLDGCAYHCDGCFVKRKNKVNDDDLKDIARLVDMWEDQGFGFNETFVGPTDIFSADNFDAIFDNEDFLALGEHFTFACVSTLLDDYYKIAARIEKIRQYSPNWRGRGFECFVMIDIEKYLANDTAYMVDLWQKLELFDLDDVFFTVNVDKFGRFAQLNLAELNKRLMDEFNPPSKDCTTGLRINPSFLRSNNAVLVLEYADKLRQIMLEEMEGDLVSQVYSNMINVHANATTFHDYTYRNHELYVAPFIYEDIPVTDSAFHIPRNEDGFWTQEQLDDKHRELFLKQMEYAERTSECSTCPHLATCTSRHMLTYMESRHIGKCILPKELLTEPGENANALAQCVRTA